MKNIKVLMIDDNVELVKMVKEYFSNHENIDISLEGMMMETVAKEESSSFSGSLISPICSYPSRFP